MADVRKPVDSPGASPAKNAPTAGHEPDKKDGWLGWLIGWVVVPGLVVAGIFGAGVYVGANHPDNWYTRAVMWAVDRN